MLIASHLTVYPQNLNLENTYKLLQFCSDCGCNRVAFLNERDSTTLNVKSVSGEQETQHYCGLGTLPDNRYSPNRRQIWKLTRSVTHALVEMFPAGMEIPNVPQLCIYLSQSKGELFLCMTGDPKFPVLLRLNQFQVEALFKRGIPIDLGTGDSVRTFTSADVYIGAPESLSIRESDHDPKRHPLLVGKVTYDHEVASNPHILKWWTPIHEQLLRRQIKQGGALDWRWFTGITAPEELDRWKREDPACKQAVWYNVLGYFLSAYADKSGLLELSSPVWRLCAVCQKDFCDISGSKVRVDICDPCIREGLESTWQEHSLGRARIVDYLQRLCALLKRVPPAYYEMRSDDIQYFSTEEMLEAFRLIRMRPDRGCIFHHFKSWFGALVKSGVLAGGVRGTLFGTHCLARDGHACRSIAEKTIDDFLHREGVQHRREVRYPDAGFVADFVIGDTLIEYFGLTGVPKYDEKTNTKITYCRQKRVRLIEIYPEDLADERLLRSKLATFLH